MSSHKLALAVAVALAAPTGGVSFAADSSSDSGAANICASANTQPPSDATNEVKAVYTQIAQKCAELKLFDVGALLGNAKTKDIASALAGFSTIQGNAGTNTDADKAAHLAEWVAKQVLRSAVAGVGSEIKESLKGAKYVVLTDDSIISTRSRYIEANKRLVQIKNALIASAADGNKAISQTPPSANNTIEPRIGVAPLLALIPPAISAAQSLASLAKQSNAFGSASVSADASELIAGLGRCLSADAAQNVRDPLLSNGLNPFVAAYDEYRVALASAQAIQGKLEVAARLAKDGKQTDRIKEIADSQTKIDTAIAAAESYEKYLATQDDSQKSTRLSTYIYAGAIFGDASTGFLLVKATQFGASYSNTKHTFKSDTLGLHASVQVTYILYAPEGTLRKSGVVSRVRSVSTSVADMQAELTKISIEPGCS